MPKIEVDAVEIISDIMENLNVLFTVLHAEGATDQIPSSVYKGAMLVLKDGTSEVDAYFLNGWAEA